MVKSHGAWQCWASPPVLLIDITGAINKEGAIQQVDEIRGLLSASPHRYRVLLAIMDRWEYSTHDAPPEFQQFHYWLERETAIRDCIYVTAGISLKKAFIELGWESLSQISRHYFNDVPQAIAFLAAQQIPCPEPLSRRADLLLT